VLLAGPSGDLQVAVELGPLEPGSGEQLTDPADRPRTGVTPVGCRGRVSVEAGQCGRERFGPGEQPRGGQQQPAGDRGACQQSGGDHQLHRPSAGRARNRSGASIAAIFCSSHQPAANTAPTPSSTSCPTAVPYGAR
jgi:hypothetical protein